MAHDVFISYSSKDQQIAAAVCRTLEANKILCWYARRDALAGVKWTSAIMEAITHCRVMVLVWSSSSSKSNHVIREMTHAFSNANDVTVIPFRVEEITATSELDYFLANIHWLVALPPPFENHLQRLLKHVQASLQEPGTEEVRSKAEEVASEEEKRLAREHAEQETLRQRAVEEARRKAAEKALERAETEAKRLADEKQARRKAAKATTEPSSPTAETAAVPLAQRHRYGSYDAPLPIEVADEEERRAHNDARRFARLLVSEIKLYNQEKVTEGRSRRDLYRRLREYIDHNRQMYDKRVKPQVVAKYDYFHNELVQAMAEGDPSKLGDDYPGPTATTLATQAASTSSSSSTETAAAPPVQRRRYGNYDAPFPVEVTDEEERRQHNDARRFARLLVSEIKLNNEQKVTEGCSQGDLYNRLRDYIDRSREMYDKRVNSRVNSQVAAKYDYFHNELVQTLAEGDPSKLGDGHPGPTLTTKAR